MTGRDLTGRLQQSLSGQCSAITGYSAIQWSQDHTVLNINGQIPRASFPFLSFLLGWLWLQRLVLQPTVSAEAQLLRCGPLCMPRCVL